MRTIKAAVCHGFGEGLRIEAVALRPPETSEVEVKVKAVAVCHSDISYADGAWGGVLPAVYGHEAAGHITAIGPYVRGLAIGDAVVITLIRACGTCVACASGRPVICAGPRDDHRGPLRTRAGGRLHQAMACGAFAERVVVDQSQVVPIAADIPLEPACLVGCGVITGVGAVVNTAQLRAGQDAVVIGAGGVGLNAIQGARLAGARRIVAVDTQPAKLDIARQFGATDSVLANSEKPWRQVHKTLGRGADAAFVSVGATAAYDSAPRYLAAGGRVILIGMPHSGALAHYEPAILAALGQGMIGSKMGDTVPRRDIPWIMDLYQQGRLHLDALISGRWPLEQINQAIADTRAGGARRNIIVFPA